MSNGAPAAGAGPPSCHILLPEHKPALIRFFERLRAQGVEQFFHPHPFTAEEAGKRAVHAGRDFYCVLMRDGEVIGYGMLRGWDEGYEIPSLGVVIDPSAQGRGYGRLLMEYLHTAARERGARRIRLRVAPGNHRALALYESLGYEFAGTERGQLTGFLGLAAAPTARKRTHG